MGHPIPEGNHTITPSLVVRGAAEAIAFYKEAFGATEIDRMAMPSPDGTPKIGHAEMRIGDSKIMLADEFPDYGSFGPQGGSSPVTIHLCVTDADATWAQAVAAGATITMPLMDMFWGDRYGKLVDPFGHHWAIAERIEEVTTEEMERRVMAFAGEACA